MPKTALEDSRDVVVIGGGVTGLWTAALLRSAGYSTAILETAALGSGQTIFSQGIIHAGVKYALTEQVKDVDLSISEMPAIWARCLEGSGEIDLSSVTVLSRSQHIWPAPGFASRLTAKIATKLLRSSSVGLTEARIPEVLKPVEGRPIFEVGETIIDSGSLLTALSRACRSPLIKVSDSDPVEFPEPGLLRIRNSDFEATVRFRFLVLAAGAGNAALIDRLRLRSPELDAGAPAMQLRPLRMVVVRSVRNGDLPVLYGHCLGTSTVPVITVTTHRDPDRRSVWYLGGGLAEEGVKLSETDQVREARATLKRCVPGLDWDSDDYRWSTVYCERAEVRTSTGGRPGGPFVAVFPGVAIAWPTKLTLAPATARRIISDLTQQGLHPGDGGSDSPLSRMEQAPVAKLPWEEVTV